MKTTTLPVSAPAWTIVDAEGQTLGRIATEVATVLRGKHRPTYSPHQLCGDHVIVINIEKLNWHPGKLLHKQYHSHSGYLGHIKSTSLNDMMKKHPDRVVEAAVKGMLPKNKLRNEMMKRLHVFVGSEHPHAPQQPTPLTIS